MKKEITFFTLLVMLFSVANAGGYQINVQGIRQNGMAHVGTGMNIGAQSIFFNPGALAMMKYKTHLVAGVSGVFANTAFQKAAPSAYTANTDNPMGTPFHFYGAYKLNEKLSFGLGAFTPYGNTIKWGDDWDGRYLISELSFFALNIQPTVSYKLTDKLSLGAGLNYYYGSVELNKMLPLYSTAGAEGKATLKGNTTGIGYTVGAYFQATEKLSIGVMYRSEVEMKIEDGDATFNVPASVASNFPDGTKFTATLPLPANINLGVSYQATDKLLFALDINYNFWSTYDSLVFDFTPNTTGLEDSHNPRLYEDAFIFRLGAEYKYCEKLTLRAGAYYDMSPVKDDYLNPETPSTNQIGLTLGASVDINSKLSIDASVLYLNGLKRDAKYSPGNFGGTYKSTTIIPGIGLSYAF